MSNPTGHAESDRRGPAAEAPLRIVEVALFDLLDAEMVVDEAAAKPVVATTVTTVLPLLSPGYEAPAIATAATALPDVASAPARDLDDSAMALAPTSARPRWADRLAVFDLETTGIDVTTSRVVTANVSRLDASGAVESRRDWLADPGVPIPEQATAVHGVTTAHARASGRRAAEVVAEIVAELRAAVDAGYTLVVYNAPYDFSLLRHEAVRHGIPPLERPGPVVDPLVVDKQLDRYRKGKRTLSAAAEFYGVSLTDAHDAGADAIAAGRVAQALAERYPDELALPASALHALQQSWHDEQCASFEDYMRRTRDPGFTARRGWPETP